MKKLNYLGFVLGVPVLLCTASATAPVSPLTATTSPVSLTYQKPSTNSTAAVKVTVATGSLFFTVDPASVPIWLSLDVMNGTAVPTTGQTLNFSSSAVLCQSQRGNL